MITRDNMVDYVDTICKNETRLCQSDIRDLQDAHNVNMCDSNDETWFDGDNGAVAHITIIDEIEFWKRYGD